MIINFPGTVVAESKNIRLMQSQSPEDPVWVKETFQRVNPVYIWRMIRMSNCWPLLVWMVYEWVELDLFFLILSRIHPVTLRELASTSKILTRSFF